MACSIFVNLPGNIKMPALGYGTWQAKDDILREGLEAALEAGYRHIDTAARYQNEEIIGSVLRKWFDSGKLKREDVFITTKLSPTEMYPDKVEGCLKESLRKLQLDYVDLYLMHFPITLVLDGEHTHGHPDVDYVDIWKKMEEQYDAGRARSIGISNFSVKKVERLLKNCRVKPANNQIEMHIYMQQKELVDLCFKNGITIVAFAPLGSRGYNTFLAGAGREAKELPDMLNDKVVLEIAKNHSKTPAQILLRFLLQLGVATIPKSTTPARIKENIDVFDFSLSNEDMAKLRALNVGPQARICTFDIFDKLPEHPAFEF